MSTLDAFASKKEINEDKIDQEENQLKSDEEIEKESRLSTKENLKDFFQFNSELERTDWFSLYINSIVTQYDPHTTYLAPEAKEVFDQNISGKFQVLVQGYQKENNKLKL